jgi:hypothetical protein
LKYIIIYIIMSLYNFTSHTFTNAGATGRLGPKLDAVRSAYSTTAWANTYLNMDGDNGIQLWTVPKTGSYTIVCAGARGGGTTPGKGVIIQAKASLTKSQKIAILVGQLGSGYMCGGGGGGSFIWKYADSTLIMSAGGGGGSNGAGTDSADNTNASYTTSGNAGTTTWGGVGGTGGNAGGFKDNTYNFWESMNGAGWLSNGSVQSTANDAYVPVGYYTDTAINMSAHSPLNDGRGGASFYASTSSIEGGFGGGGGGGGESNHNSSVGGGGGGYSGGGNGGNNSMPLRGSGGGGGSYTSGLTSVSNYGYTSSHGYVTITMLTSPATLTFLKTTFYVKYVLNSTISIPAALISTNNTDTDTYTLTHSSGTTGGNTGVATVSTSANEGTVTIKGLGTTTITSTLAATANFDEITTTSITITVIGSGSTVTGATMTSIDLSETDLTGSVLSGCDLTSANLYGATFNAATDLRGSTLTSLRSGRIIGNTTLLPTEYKII